MMQAFLRGIDCRPDDVPNELRFCNPLLSFDQEEGALLYYALDVAWSYTNAEDYENLTLVHTDQIDAFATLIVETRQIILPGQGVPILGRNLYKAARSVGVAVRDASSLSFTESGDGRFLFTTAKAESYCSFCEQLIESSKEAFDFELRNATSRGISSKGQYALLLLQSCGLTEIEDMGIRQLTAAKVGRHRSLYSRLLTRLSLELGRPEDDIEADVLQHIEHVSPRPSNPEHPRRPQVGAKQTYDSVYRNSVFAALPATLTARRLSRDATVGSQFMSKKGRQPNISKLAFGSLDRSLAYRRRKGSIRFEGRNIAGMDISQDRVVYIEEGRLGRHWYHSSSVLLDKPRLSFEDVAKSSLEVQPHLGSDFSRKANLHV